MDFSNYIMTCVSLTDEPAIACPVCGYEWVHPVGLKCQSPGTRNGLVTIDAHGIDINPRKLPSGRGVEITLKFMGECGHAFEYTLRFHKGVTYVLRRANKSRKSDVHCPQVIWRD